jgi:hypothetical protein
VLLWEDNEVKLRAGQIAPRSDDVCVCVCVCVCLCVCVCVFWGGGDREGIADTESVGVIRCEVLEICAGEQLASGAKAREEAGAGKQVEL